MLISLEHVETFQLLEVTFSIQNLSELSFKERKNNYCLMVLKMAQRKMAKKAMKKLFC